MGEKERPLRTCDIYTAEEVPDKFRKFCNRQGNCECDFGRGLSYCACLAKWMTAPCEGEPLRTPYCTNPAQVRFV